MTRFLTIAVAMLLIAGALSACGRKGDPDAPPGSTYPRTYPNQ
ncbi:LPS translocon maturation chaperone LptM [Magnetovibrio sp.]